MKSKLNVGMTLCRARAKLVTSNIMRIYANNYAEVQIEGIPEMTIVLQPERLDLNQSNVITLNQVQISINE